MERECVNTQINVACDAWGQCGMERECVNTQQMSALSQLTGSEQCTMGQYPRNLIIITNELIKCMLPEYATVCVESGVLGSWGVRG